MTRRKPHGFSYVEVLTVLAIVTLIFGLVVPGYVKYSRGKAAMSAAISLCGDLQKAQYLALEKESDVRITFSVTPSRTTYSIDQFNSKSNSWTSIKSGIDITSKYYGTYIENVSGSTSSLVFGEGGKITSASGISSATETGPDTRIDYYPIVFNNSGVKYVVKTYYTGHIKWEKLE